jgi:16S rRNA (cytosine1402-N4)-methyltransferase
VPVLLKEVIEVIAPASGKRYFDGTLGGGGHASAILDKSSPEGFLAGTDLDKESLLNISKKFSTYGNRVYLFDQSYTAIDTVCNLLGWEALDGIILDLGISTIALDDPDRGFSFLHEGPLDMRFSSDNSLDAYKVVNTYEAGQLVRILYSYGEERFAPRIAKAITNARPIKTTTELAGVVSSAIPRRFWPKNIHPATKTFQAIRIEVNKELSNLEEFLPKAVKLLCPGGVIAIISFHSLEDRIVKQFFSGIKNLHTLRGLPISNEIDGPHLVSIFKKPLKPGPDEVALNPRARSALLRAARRVS